MSRTRQRPAMRLGAALRRRRRLRTGLVQFAYIVGAVGLGLLLPQISVGATIESRSVREMLVAVGAAFVPFIGIIYSLLFLVVQFGTTTFTSRASCVPAERLDATRTGPRPPRVADIALRAGPSTTRRRRSTRSTRSTVSSA
jgi:hypothetical protein